MVRKWTDFMPNSNTDMCQISSFFYVGIVRVKTTRSKVCSVRMGVIPPPPENYKSLTDNHASGHLCVFGFPVCPDRFEVCRQVFVCPQQIGNF